MTRTKNDAPEETPEENITENTQTSEAENQTASEENSSAETAPVGRPATVRSPKGLNLRKGPALSYEILCVLPDGAEATALDLPMGAEVPGWRLIYTGERIGWVQSRFLRLEG